MWLELNNVAELELRDTKHGRTPLSWAARNGNGAVVQLLLDKRAENCRYDLGISEVSALRADPLLRRRQLRGGAK